MNIASRVPGQLNQVSDSQINPTESIVRVDPIFNLIQKAPLSVPDGIQAGTVPARTSIIQSGVLQVANAGSATLDLLQLAKGLWELAITATFSANYDGGANLLCQVVLVDPLTASSHTLIGFVALPGATNGGLSSSITFPFLAVTEPWIVRLVALANGVGNIHRIGAAVIASKFI